MMELRVLYAGARSATLLLADGGLYETAKTYDLFLNGAPIANPGTAVFSLFDLTPDVPYTLTARSGGEEAVVSFHTEAEAYTLDVRAFGAVGDGAHDDTAAIQAAILCCPDKGRVLIKKGDYLVSPLFLKSHVRIELQKGAALRLTPDRARCPILPGMVARRDEKDDLNLGSWEGNPLDMYAALITGVGVSDAVIYGEGTLDGQGALGGWWREPKAKRGAWRGRMLFLNRCENVVVQGLSFKDSPAWNLHPYFSQNLKFLNVSVSAPKDSPNTDGFDPESCQNVLLAGARFSLGDDCVAIKSGKLYMGKTYHTPCQNIEIAHCLMENGHGGVTIGSETAGGVYHVRVHHCLMRNTDRCLRVKTRRGRGENAVIDDIRFSHIRAENVKAPFVINAFYFCDPDGHSEYVQTRDAQPKDGRTPSLKAFLFEHIACSGAVCAGVFLGLPEAPIERIELHDIRVRYTDAKAPFAAVMADGFAPLLKRGLIAQNVKELILNGVDIDAEPRLETDNVTKIKEENV